MAGGCESGPLPPPPHPATTNDSSTAASLVFITTSSTFLAARAPAPLHARAAIVAATPALHTQRLVACHRNTTHASASSYADCARMTLSTLNQCGARRRGRSDASSVACGSRWHHQTPDSRRAVRRGTRLAAATWL